MKCTARLCTKLRALLGSAFCVLTCLALAQQPPVTVERLGVSETLLGILSYARWPNESMPLFLLRQNCWTDWFELTALQQPSKSPADWHPAPSPLIPTVPHSTEAAVNPRP